MTKLSLSVAAVVAVMAAAFAPSLRAQQSAPRFEYVRVSPFIVIVNTGPQSVREGVGYRACLAASTEWTCRKFESTETGDVALRTALVTLGDEGWELVSAVEDIRGGAHAVGLTYLFKRPR